MAIMATNSYFVAINNYLKLSIAICSYLKLLEVARAVSKQQ